MCRKELPNGESRKRCGLMFCLFVCLLFVLFVCLSLSPFPSCTPFHVLVCVCERLARVCAGYSLIISSLRCILKGEPIHLSITRKPLLEDDTPCALNVRSTARLCLLLCCSGCWPFCLCFSPSRSCLPVLSFPSPSHVLLLNPFVPPVLF